MVKNNEFLSAKRGASRLQSAPARASWMLVVCTSIAFPVALKAQPPAADSGVLTAKITTADGQTTNGQIVEIDSRGVHVSSGSATTVLPLEELSLIRADNGSATTLPMQVQLSGGSQVRITGLVWTDGQVKIMPARQSAFEVPVEKLQWVRFRAGNSATDPTWLGWLEETRRGDRLIVRRNEKALDAIDGTVVAISRESVNFEMRGNPVTAPIAKLEGVMLSSPAAGSASPTIRVTDTSGSVWAAQSVRLEKDASLVSVDLAESLEHKIPIDQIREIQFAGGVLPLAEAEIASASFGYAAGGDASERLLKPPSVADLEEWFAPQTDGGVISLNTPGEITFRIPEGYQRFVVAARRDQQVSQFIAIELAVLLDGKEKWTGMLQDRQSQGLELDLGGARRLTLRARPMPAKADAVDKAGALNDAAANQKTAVDIVPAAALGGAVQWFSGRLLK